MARIVVFDSGLGSLSIIKPIQRIYKSEIIYFADQKNFPYGKKSIIELKEILNQSILKLTKEFSPDLIVIGSNTLSLLFDFKSNTKIIGVLPPISLAIKKSKSKNIAILATNTIIKNNYLKKIIPLNSIFNIHPINASPLIDLVEDGSFMTNKSKCIKKIKVMLQSIFLKNNVDVVILSSTHLPFLLPLLQKIFPNILFLDPGNLVANTILNKNSSNLNRNKLLIFTSGNKKEFRKKLIQINIFNQVKFLSLE
jgi:glutamate racemase